MYENVVEFGTSLLLHTVWVNENSSLCIIGRKKLSYYLLIKTLFDFVILVNENCSFCINTQRKTTEVLRIKLSILDQHFF